MRPKLITFFCIALFIIGALQFVGSVGAIMIGNGIGPEKIFNRDEHVQVPVEDEAASVRQGDQGGAPTRVVPEHIIPAGKYGLLMNLAFLISLVGLWKMKKWGVYAFGVASVVNIWTMLVWRPEWLMQSQSPAGAWMSLLLPIIYFAVVLPYWKQLDMKLERKEAGADEEQNPLLKLWR